MLIHGHNNLRAIYKFSYSLYNKTSDKTWRKLEKFNLLEDIKDVIN